MMRQTALAAALVACSILAGSGAPGSADPAQNLARLRLIVVATAATTDITVEGATLASYTSSILQAAEGSGASQTGHVMRLSNKAPGHTAEAEFDIVLAGVVPLGTITWDVATYGQAATDVEVYSTNDPEVPRRVDRFSTHGPTARFTTLAMLVASYGRLAVQPVVPHLVLAEYYAWYDTTTWQDPQVIDRPLEPYSSDDPAAIRRQLQQAHSAAIDAFVVSWQGRSIDWNNRRMQMLLDAAGSANMRVCLFIESFFVNPGFDVSQPTDPATMVKWIEDAVDLYGKHPSYLRLSNRPVIFVYSASRLSEAQWRAVLTAVRASGRDPVVIGDFYHSRLINVLDGEYQYINVTLSSADLHTQDLVETLRVRTWNLLPPYGPRRIWIASVCPGYDDRRLAARTAPVFVDRANGRVYDDEWSAAVTTAADWVMITTWNEFFENSYIEPSARYGTAYLDHTRAWSLSFKGLSSQSRRAKN